MNHFTKHLNLIFVAIWILDRANQCKPTKLNVQQNIFKGTLTYGFNTETHKHVHYLHFAVI